MEGEGPMLLCVVKSEEIPPAATNNFLNPQVATA